MSNYLNLFNINKRNFQNKEKEKSDYFRQGITRAELIYKTYLTKSSCIKNTTFIKICNKRFICKIILKWLRSTQIMKRVSDCKQHIDNMTAFGDNPKIMFKM